MFKSLTDMLLALTINVFRVNVLIVLVLLFDSWVDPSWVGGSNAGRTQIERFFFATTCFDVLKLCAMG